MFRFCTNGSPFERGKQQGIACASRALPWLEHEVAEIQKRMGERSADCTIQRVRPQLEMWRRRVRDAAPCLEDECRGIAAGLGLAEERYFAGLYGGWLLGDWVQEDSPNCTTAAFRDRHGRALLGKTDDILENQLGMNVLEVTTPEHGLRHVHFHFAGTVWTVAGMNECGLAMGMNGIPGPRLDREGLPSLEALHTILPACRTVPEAVDHIRKLPVTYYGFSLVLGDAAGEVALLEKTGAGFCLLPPQPEDFHLHTNHILDPTFAARNPPQVSPIRENGVARFANALARLRRGHGTDADMIGLLGDRCTPGAVWQTGEDGLHTDFAVLLEPADRRMHVWTGEPPPADGETVSIEDAFGNT